jgi:hypothetical protein
LSARGVRCKCGGEGLPREIFVPVPKSSVRGPTPSERKGGRGGKDVGRANTLKGGQGKLGKEWVRVTASASVVVGDDGIWKLQALTIA